MRKPASRGDTGLSNAFRQVSDERSTPATATLQARTLSRRYGLSAAVAAVVAGHLYAAPEHWSARA
jgi:hypothetical protein